jgi:hypothetical protein
MFRKEKCRRRNAGTRTAVLKPQSLQFSCTTTLAPGQEPLSPPPCQRRLYPLRRPYPFLKDRHLSVAELLSCS